MNTQVNTTDLLNALNVAVKVASPAFGLKVTVGCDRVVLSTYDNTTYATSFEASLSSVSCENVGDDTTIVVDAKQMLNAVKASASPETSLSITHNQLRVDLSLLPGLTDTLGVPDTYAIWEDFKGDSPVPMSLSCKKFKPEFEFLVKASAKKDVRYYLNGMLFHKDGKELKLVTTDGHRLHKVENIYDFASEGELQTILTNTAFPAVKVLLQKFTTLDIKFSKDCFMFSAHKSDLVINLVVKAVDGKFPQYERVVPKRSNHQTMTATKPVVDAIKRAKKVIGRAKKVIGRANLPAVRLHTYEGVLTLGLSKVDVESKGSIKVGEMQVESDLVLKDDQGFDLNYLIDALSGFSPGVEVKFGGPNEAALIEDDSKTSVVMPMRL